MARGKNAPALFEVIRNAQEKQRQQDQRQNDQRQREAAQAVQGDGRSGTAAGGELKSAANLLRSPLFWFKGRAAHEANEPASDRAEPVMREIPAAPAAEPRQAAPASPVKIAPAEPAIAKVDRRQPLVAESIAAPAAPPNAAAAPAYRPAVAQCARQVREEIAAQDGPAAQTFAAEPFAAEPFFNSRPPQPIAKVFADPAQSDDEADNHSAARQPDFAIDRERRQISLRLSYTNAIIACFALLVACGLAYMIGSAGRGRTTVAGVQPGVLDLSPPPAIAEGANLVQGLTDARANVENSPSAVALDNGGKKIDVPTSVKRIVGYQYLVPMSYKNAEDAARLVKFLADNGIAATAEKPLPGYSSAYFSIVTARGFDHTLKNPQFDVFVASLGKLMQKYSATSRYAAKEPAIYSWHSTN